MSEEDVVIWIIILSNTFTSLISFWVESINMPFAMHLVATCWRFLGFFSPFTFFPESKNYSTSIFIRTDCKSLPKSPSSMEEEERKKTGFFFFFQPVLCAFCILQAGEQSGEARSDHSAPRSISPGWREETVFTCAERQGAPTAMPQWHCLMDVPLVITDVEMGGKWRNLFTL